MDEEILTIETPEHVELQFTPASLGNRFLACAIDHFIQVAAVVLVITIGYQLSAGVRALGARLLAWEEINLWISAAGIVLLFLVFFGYFIFFETIWSGQTPGKRWLKLRVIQQDGRPINFFSSMTRNILRMVDLIVPPFYSIGLISVFVSRDSKRVGDFVANTVVIKERSAEAPSFEEVFSGELIDTAMRREAAPVDFQGDVRVVTPAEILPVETFLRRRDRIPASPRQWLAWRIATPLLEKIRPAFDPATFNYEGFLEELLARYRAQKKYRGE